MSTGPATDAFAKQFAVAEADARQRLGRLKKELAAACGLRPDDFSKLLAGVRRPTHRGMVLRIARGLQMGREGTDDLLRAAGFGALTVDESWEFALGRWEGAGVDEDEELPQAARDDTGQGGDVVGLVMALSRAVQGHLAVCLAPLGVSYAQATVLTVLSPARPVRQERLIHGLDITRASALVLISQLVAMGLIVQGRTDPDHGVFWLELTPAGRQLNERIGEVFRNVEMTLLWDIPDNQQGTARDLLARMLTELNSRSMT